MIRRPQIVKHTDSLLPYPTLFRSPRLRIASAQTNQNRPIKRARSKKCVTRGTGRWGGRSTPRIVTICPPALAIQVNGLGHAPPPGRSEEHTSELQSLMRISYAVFCLKQNKQNKKTIANTSCINTPYTYSS